MDTYELSLIGGAQASWRRGSRLQRTSRGGECAGRGSCPRRQRSWTGSCICVDLGVPRASGGCGRPPDPV